MLRDFLRWLTGPSARTRPPRARRTRLSGCLLWLLVLIAVLVVIALLFGGFREGTKAAGPGAPGPALAAIGRLA
jgi:hypothetical protein